MLISLQNFSVLYGPTYILIYPRLVSPQMVVINYQNTTKSLNDSHLAPDS
jgi:hypothetical protein